MADVKLDNILDNETINVTRFTVPAGWVGEHSHPGNQLAVVLSPTTVTYKQNGTEFTKQYDVGDIIWIDSVTHDHAADGERSYLMVTVK